MSDDTYNLTLRHACGEDHLVVIRNDQRCAVGGFPVDFNRVPEEQRDFYRDRISRTGMPPYHANSEVRPCWACCTPVFIPPQGMAVLRLVPHATPVCYYCGVTAQMEQPTRSIILAPTTATYTRSY